MVLNGEPCLLLELRSTGTMFRRDASSFNEVVDDFDIRLPQVVVPRERFDALLRALRQWQTDQEEFSVDLDWRDATLTLEVAHRPDVGGDRWKPAFTLYYSCAQNRIEVTFLVDASCLLEWSEGLEQAVAVPN
ncbi:hypothetical protein D7X74_31710 [Corallococcus sp. CA047B]|uniref:hypothetical protein n=1 Tax=Corallococcus sp. CA047B TaxID=2316729 RepID=UPI000EA087BA|nr:hypothetical protein [Corallococcus sp. CA047B]RKH08383.1 hypothetical protein D7X74_31710 [Corallococcus sp. CA047B]